MFKILPGKDQFSIKLHSERKALGTGYFTIFRKGHNSALLSGISFLLHQFCTKRFWGFDTKAVKMHQNTRGWSYSSCFFNQTKYRRGKIFRAVVFGVKGEAMRAWVTEKPFYLSLILSLSLLLPRNPDLLLQALQLPSPTQRTHSQELIKYSHDCFVLVKGTICMCFYDQELHSSLFPQPKLPPTWNSQFITSFLPFPVQPSLAVSSTVGS